MLKNSLIYCKINLESNMKLNYILSDTTKSATTNAITQIAKQSNAEKDGKFLVIVPETKSIIIERELLSYSTHGSYANVFVYSFVRLLDRIGAVPPEKLLSKQAAIILLKKIIYENLDKLDCYKKTAKTIGFAEKVYDTIAQFKSSEVTPEQLLTVLSTTKKSFCSKLKDLIFLYSEYEKQIHEKFYDDCDKLSLLSKFAKENEFLAESKVFVIGFDSITFEMQRVLRDIAINSKEITFSAVFYKSPNPSLLLKSNELFHKFSHIADELKFPYVPKFFPSKKTGDFLMVQKNILGQKVNSQKWSNDIEIFEAKTKKQEVDFVANTIINGIKNGKRFKDFGVLLADIEGDLDLIKTCFDVYKIPYFANVPTKVENHFLVKFIRSAFELFLFHLSDDKVLNFLSNPLFDANDFSLILNFVNETGTNYDEFLENIDENYVLKHKNNFEIFSEEFSDKTLSDENKNFNKLDVLQADLGKFRKFYLSFSEKLSNCKIASEWIDSIGFLLEQFNVVEKLSKIADFERDEGMLIEAEVSEQILNKLSRLFEQMKNFLNDTKLSAQEFLGIFDSAVASITISVAPVSIDSVIIQENTDGFFDIDEMFIVGAIDGKFPSCIHDSGIILDSELIEAKQLSGKTIEHAVSDINRREKFRVYETLLEPVKKLYVSYSLTSEEGKVNAPANFVSSLISLFGEKSLKKDYKKSDFVNFNILERQFAKSVNNFLNDEANLSDANKLFSQLGTNISPILKNFLLTIESGKHDFQIQNASEIYFKDGYTSVSQLQTYFDCPYKFFVNYGLRLKEPKYAKLSFPDIGTVIHRIVEIFGKEIDEYKNLTETQLHEKIFLLVKNVLEEAKINLQKNKSLFKMLSFESERLIKYILLEQSCSNFKLKSSEFVFSGENSIKLKLSDGTELKLRGKIDRIDEFSNYVRIIDYKTGDVKNDLKLIFYGNKIQLCSYLEAIRSSKKKVVGLFYFPVHSDYSKDENASKEAYRLSGFMLDNIDIVKNMDTSLNENNLRSFLIPVTIKFDDDGQVQFAGKNKRYSEKELENINDYVKKLCSVAGDEVLSGFIEPSPIADDNSELPVSCKNCKVKGFCGLEKSNHPFGRSFIEKVDELSFDLGEDCERN